MYAQIKYPNVKKVKNSYPNLNIDKIFSKEISLNSKFGIAQCLSMYMGSDQKAAVEKLAQSCSGMFHNEQSIPFGTMSLNSTADSNLILWGHGNSTHFGSHESNYTPIELLNRLNNLELSPIKTIGLISCASSSEYQPGVDIANVESYAEGLQKLLNNISTYSSLGIKVKTLPAPKVDGQNSLLHRFNTSIDKFIYLTGSDDFIRQYKTEVGRLRSIAPQSSNNSIAEKYTYEGSIKWLKANKALTYKTDNLSSISKYLENVKL